MEGEIKIEKDVGMGHDLIRPPFLIAQPEAGEIVIEAAPESSEERAAEAAKTASKNPYTPADLDDACACLNRELNEAAKIVLLVSQDHPDLPARFAEILDDFHARMEMMLRRVR